MVHVLRFQYTLSQETIDYLKQPTFDIWHWEPNEVMYESWGNRSLQGPVNLKRDTIMATKLPQ